MAKFSDFSLTSKIFATACKLSHPSREKTKYSALPNVVFAVWLFTLSKVQPEDPKHKRDTPAWKLLHVFGLGGSK